jgi:hypothetical protein
LQVGALALPPRVLSKLKTVLSNGLGFIDAFAESFQRKRRGGEMLLEKTGQARADFFKHVFMKR